MPKVISRAEAKEQGLKNYFTGIECKNKHIAKRQVSNTGCIECRKLNSRAYYKTEKGITYLKKYHKSDKFKANKKKYLSSEKGQLKTKEYNLSEERRKSQHKYNTSELGKLGSKKYYNSEKGKKFFKDYWLSDEYKQWNKERTKTKEYKEYVKNYRDKNRARINETSRKNQKIYFEKNPKQYLAAKLRNSINIVLKNVNIKKTQRLNKIIGCNLDTLKMHIEKQFKGKMSWKNKSEWHIDHIVPINYFIKNYYYFDEDIQRISFHYSNLQPMWAKENIIKSDKISKQVAEKKIAEIRKLINA